jgi:hypothetical protein
MMHSLNLSRLWRDDFGFRASFFQCLAWPGHFHLLKTVSHKYRNFLPIQLSHKTSLVELTLSGSIARQENYAPESGVGRKLKSPGLFGRE